MIPFILNLFWLCRDKEIPFMQCR